MVILNSPRHRRVTICFALHSPPISPSDQSHLVAPCSCLLPPAPPPARSRFPTTPTPLPVESVRSGRPIFATLTFSKFYLLNFLFSMASISPFLVCKDLLEYFWFPPRPEHLLQTITHKIRHHKQESMCESVFNFL